MTHPDRIEDLDPAGSCPDKALLSKIGEDARDHLSNRTNAVRQILLIHERGKTAAGRRLRCREIEQMSGDALADRCKRVSSEFLEDVVQPVDRLFRQNPRDRSLGPRPAPDAVDIDKEGGAGSYRLHEDRRRSANERRRSEQITHPNVSHGDLPAVAGMHVDAKQTLHDDRQPRGLRFCIYGLACRELQDSPAEDERVDGLRWYRSPTSASQQADDFSSGGLSVGPIGGARHMVRLDENVDLAVRAMTVLELPA